MIEGLIDGHAKILQLVGIGYRASIEDKNLCLNVGYSDTKKLPIPDDLEVILSGQTTIIVYGNDKQEVGEFASLVRKVRKPEVYKGKGIRYKDEIVRIKAPSSKK
ncbi:large ribosomal subunit protein uL6-like [Zophobas morio]|uniref:large ribosomal subunit protein uL6-like n=1 Tax=Zophobas morio TaxID=2755281 RepID=UPI003083044B